MRKTHVRMLTVLFIFISISLILALVLYALRNNIDLFYYPNDLQKQTELPRHKIRLGGLVAEGSMKRYKDMYISFSVTDNKHTVEVKYKGILPDLFKEGQGVVASGKFKEDKIFVADNIMAKHDENYYPGQMNAS